jgi:hypothetical protein
MLMRIRSSLASSPAHSFPYGTPIIGGCTAPGIVTDNLYLSARDPPVSHCGLVGYGASGVRWGMLMMDQVHVIRHKVLVDGRSRRQVARELGISRLTARKYVEQAAPPRCKVLSGSRSPASWPTLGRELTGPRRSLMVGSLFRRGAVCQCQTSHRRQSPRRRLHPRRSLE